MKITSSTAFKNWCDQAPKVRERIVFAELPDEQKDQAVIAYCWDFGGRPMKAMALHLQSATCAKNTKESAYRNSEYAINELVIQYNDLLDLRDAGKSDPYENLTFCENAFKRIFRTDQALIDSGHKNSDFS